MGANGGACIVYETGISGAAELNRLLTGGMDFYLALRGNAGAPSKAGRTAGRLKKLKPLVDVLVKVGAKRPDVLKHALKAPDKLGDFYKAVTALRRR